MSDKEDFVDVDDKLTYLIEDFAAAARYALQNAGDGSAGEDDLHRAYQAVKAFGPQTHERRESITSDGTKTLPCIAASTWSNRSS